MATIIKKNRKLKEADQFVDQNLAAEPASPATPTDVASAPIEPVAPQDDTIVEPAVEEPSTDSPIEVDPETVSMEVKVPTDQLAAAVAQSTGDMEAAEVAPDAMANQEADLVSEVGTEEEAAPVEQPQDQPVMESKKVRAKKIKEADESMGELDAAEAAEKHDQDKLEDIIDTGVANMGDSIGDSNATDDGQNRLDLIKDGTDNMKEFLNNVSIGGPNVSANVNPTVNANANVQTDDVAVGVGGTAKTQDQDAIQESLEEDAIKNAGVTTADEVEEEAEEEPEEEVEDDEDSEDYFDFNVDVPGLEEGDGLDDIDAEFAEPDTEEFISNVEDFLAQEDTEDVVDALQTTASFLSQIARKPGEKALDFDAIPEGDGEDEELFGDEIDLDDIEDDASDEPEVEDIDDIDEDDLEVFDDEEEEDDIDEDDLDARLEDFLSNSKKYESNPLSGLVNQLLSEKRFAMRNRMTEKSNSVSNVKERRVEKVVSKKQPLNEAIIYPAGSEPAKVDNDTDMVRTNESISNIRENAIRNYRQTLKRQRESQEVQDDEENRSRFNNALKSSVKSVKRESNSNSWESNNFTSRYKERLDFNELLRNHYLG